MLAVSPLWARQPVAFTNIEVIMGAATAAPALKEKTLKSRTLTTKRQGNTHTLQSDGKTHTVPAFCGSISTATLASTAHPSRVCSDMHTHTEVSSRHKRARKGVGRSCCKIRREWKKKGGRGTGMCSPSANIWEDSHQVFKVRSHQGVCISRNPHEGNIVKTPRHETNSLVSCQQEIPAEDTPHSNGTNRTLISREPGLLGR